MNTKIINYAILQVHVTKYTCTPVILKTNVTRSCIITRQSNLIYYILLLEVVVQGLHLPAP